MSQLVKSSAGAAVGKPSAACCDKGNGKTKGDELAGMKGAAAAAAPACDSAVGGETTREYVCRRGMVYRGGGLKLPACRCSVFVLLKKTPWKDPRTALPPKTMLSDRGLFHMSPMTIARFLDCLNLPLFTYPPVLTEATTCHDSTRAFGVYGSSLLHESCLSSRGGSCVS